MTKLKDIEDYYLKIVHIRNLLGNGNYEFSLHALKNVIERNISNDELIEISKNLEFVEEYPNDKYAPSCLVLGFTHTGRPLHVLVTLMESGLLRIITAYEPDKNSWHNYRKRRGQM